MYDVVNSSGVGRSARLSGQRPSSTRAEIAGLALALTPKFDLCVKLDSLNTCRTVWALQKGHTNLVAKPWALRPNGDLWRLVRGLLQRRPQRGVQFIKIPLHTTPED
eukprot:15472182-Alexandrium_andersonii.AAC.1